MEKQNQRTSLFIQQRIQQIMQKEAEIKNIKGKGQREGGKKKTEGEKEGEGEKGKQNITAWILNFLPLCFCSPKA